jgi:hypothetical protein
VADHQWRARRGLAAAVLRMGDKPGFVVEVANELWDSWRLAQRAPHVLHRTFMRIAVFARGLKARCAIVVGLM